MKYNRFDLEQLILKNWEITTEIKHLYEKVLEDGTNIVTRLQIIYFA